MHPAREVDGSLLNRLPLTGPMTESLVEGYLIRDV
jgi:hypothetical protein